VPFAFGGKSEPDLKWRMEASARGWLEIHRGAFSVFDDLQQDLDRELEATNAILRVRLGEWPLEVSDRNLLRTRISRAIDAAVADGAEQVVPMPEISPGATGVIETGRGRFLLGRVLVETPGFWPSDGYLASVAARLVWLNDVPVEWEDLPFAAVAVCFSDLHGSSLWGSWPASVPERARTIRPHHPFRRRFANSSITRLSLYLARSLRERSPAEETSVAAIGTPLS
jgi:hypothetical protein